MIYRTAAKQSTGFHRLAIGVNVLALLMVFHCQAQNSSIVYDHFNMDNGLIHDEIEFIHVDQEGYVWVATGFGVQRFDGYNFKTYNSNSGKGNKALTDKFVTTIFEDHLGNLWFATSTRGLNLLNKKLQKFHHFSHDPQRLNTLTDDRFRRSQKLILQDRNQDIWVNTVNGINRINLETNEIQPFYGDFDGQIVYDEKTHVIWIAGDALKKFDLNSLKLTDYFSTGSEIKSFTSVLMDKEGLLWLGSDHGLQVFDPEKGQFNHLGDALKRNNTDIDHIANAPISSIYQDYTGSLWIASENKIFIINPRNGGVQKLVNQFGNPNSLLDTSISGIYGRQEGIVWVAYTTKGMSRLNIRPKGFVSYGSDPGDKTELNDKTVRSIFRDSKDNLWIGTFNSGVLHYSDLELRNPKNYKHVLQDSTTINSNYVTALYVDSRERLWVGSYERGFCYADKVYNEEIQEFHRFPSTDRMEVHEFTEDKFGRIWISTDRGMYIYNPDNGQIIRYGSTSNQDPMLRNINVQSVAFQDPNIFWLATWDSGIVKLIINSDSLFTPVIQRDSMIVINSIETVSEQSVDLRFVTIYQSTPNVFWLGSYNNGLIKMTTSPNGVGFESYDKSYGAPENTIYGIADDREGNIWVSTMNGIGKFNPESKQFLKYYKSHGLLTNGFIWDASYRHSDGKIYFGAKHGMTTFYPENVVNDTTLSKPFIANVAIQYKEINPGDTINDRVILEKDIRYTNTLTLTHREPVCMFEFAAINMVDPGKVLFAYKLEGFDQDWIITDASTRTATYTNLPAGTYHFRVKATNSHGVWIEEPASLELVILPPWWKTWWAYFLYVLTFIGLLYAFRTYVLKWAELNHNLQLERITHEKDNELNKAKLRFFTNISHELRTPLSLIIDPLNRLVDNPPSSQRVQRHLQVMVTNAHRLMRLINQLMDFRKFESDKLKLKAASGNIIKFINEVVISFKQRAREQHISFSFKHPEGPLEVWYDRDKMEIILYNLISNSFRFTPKHGKIAIEVRATRVDDCKFLKSDDTVCIGNLPENNREVIEISVVDNGSGIHQEHLRKIFKRFYQVNQDEMSISAGTGIGLALTKNLVELHHGIIAVQSEKGVGTRFNVYLPLGDEHLDPSEIIKEFKNSEDRRHYQLVEESLELPASEPDYTTESKEKPVLLIADDNSDVRTYIVDALKSNYRLVEAEDGKQALRLAQDEMPDLVISDVLMPEMDGIELCHQLKSNVKTSHIPIILLTARTSLLYRIEGLDTGADAYMTKPFNSKLLKVRINNLIESRKRIIEKLKKEALLNPKDISLTSPDELFLENAIEITEKYISDPEFNVQVMAREIGLSHSLLYKKISALTGMSIVEFIRTIRLKRAAQILSNSTWSVAEVSSMVGFSDPKYFSKCFAKQFGKTPSQYAFQATQTTS